MTDYGKAIELLERAGKIALICHVNPDGDTLGSALALRSFLIKKGKAVDVICDDEKTGKLDFLLDKNPVIGDSDEQYDLAVSVDCGDLERMGNARKNFLRAKSKLVIDHHKTNDRRGDVNVVECDAAATAQIMFKMLSQYDGACITKAEASLLYAGLLTDSGGFYYESTTPETHEVAGGLIEIIGAYHNYIYYKLFEEVERGKFLLHHDALAKAKFFDEGKIAMISFSTADFERTGTDISHTEGAVSNLLKIEGVLVAITLTEVAKHSYKVSFRSRGAVDVSQSASYFGGGGHKNASGCRVCGYFEDVKDKILKSVRDIL